MAKPHDFFRARRGCSAPVGLAHKGRCTAAPLLQSRPSLDSDGGMLRTVARL